MTLHSIKQWPRRWWVAWGLLLVGTMLIVVLVTLPPFVDEGFREVLMHGFGTVCHQLPSRSPQIDGIPLAVCHRCYGIYWGLPLAALAFLVLYRWDALLRPYAPHLLVLSLVPSGIDWLGDVLGFWTNTPLSRLLTGGLFGLVAGYFLARAVREAVLQRKKSDPAQETTSSK